jgi:hypothetical protein
MAQAIDCLLKTPVIRPFLFSKSGCIKSPPRLPDNGRGVSFGQQIAVAQMTALVQ